MNGAGAAYDVITMGRVSVDLYPLQSGVALSEVHTFERFLGGSPTNVAVAAARLGRRSAIITKVGAEGFGPFVRSALARFGVETRFVGTHEKLLTPIVFCELFPPDDFPLLFYRLPSAPDLTIETSELDREAIVNARIFWSTGTGLCEEPSRSATLAALAWRHEALSAVTTSAAAADGMTDDRPLRHTIHDLDYRPMFWKSQDTVMELQRRALSMATVAVGNQAEAATAVGIGTPEEQAERLLALGVKLAIVKMGPAGTLIASAAGMHRIAPTPVKVVNGLGAGDAFGGAVCHGLLAGWTPVQIATFASAAGAYVAGQLSCADAMPTEAEVRALLIPSRHQPAPSPSHAH